MICTKVLHLTVIWPTISTDGPDSPCWGVGGHSCQSQRQFEYQVDNHQMSDGINYKTCCTCVCVKVNEQYCPILDSRLNTSNSIENMLFHEDDDILIHNVQINLMQTGDESKIYDCLNNIDSEDNVSNLTTDSSINTFSFESCFINYTAPLLWQERNLMEVYV